MKDVLDCICFHTSYIEASFSKEILSVNASESCTYEQFNLADPDYSLKCTHSSNRKVEGFIKSVIPAQNIVIINNQKYQIDKDCQITRNGIPVSLTSCGPINDKLYQWCRAELIDHKIVSLKVCYKVIEGLIEEVDNKNNQIYIKVYNTPDVKGGLQKFLLDKKIVQPDSSIQKRDKIIAAVGCDRILHIFSIK